MLSSVFSVQYRVSLQAWVSKFLDLLKDSVGKNVPNEGKTRRIKWFIKDQIYAELSDWHVCLPNNVAAIALILKISYVESVL